MDLLTPRADPIGYVAPPKKEKPWWDFARAKRNWSKGRGDPYGSPVTGMLEETGMNPMLAQAYGYLPDTGLALLQETGGLLAGAGGALADVTAPIQGQGNADRMARDMGAMAIEMPWVEAMALQSPSVLQGATGAKMKAADFASDEVGALNPGGYVPDGRTPQSVLDFRRKKRSGASLGSTDLPDLRTMSTDDATRTARGNPHLLPAGDRSGGMYIGGAEGIKSRQDLTNLRRGVDKEIEMGALGADWYDRYRAGVYGVTDNANDALWMSNLEGQYSAGVAPGSELGYSLKDTNSGIAYGLPDKPARPAQQQASIRAIQANDPTLMQLGKKTGEYANRINPYNQTTIGGGTGVNDFRYANTWGHRGPGGEQFNAALTDAQHKFMDYETANAVDRANKSNLGGRSDWTGEQIQAAPWVQQKSQALIDGTWAFDEDLGKQVWKSGRRKSFTEEAKVNLRNEGIDAPTEDQIERGIQAIGFREANKTIADFYPKHTAHATREALPYANSGHLPMLGNASEAEKLDFFKDPRMSWDTAPNNRDALYAGMRLDDTGYAVRTQPSIEAQGYYDPPGAPEEFNPSKVSKPLVGLNTAQSGALKGERTVQKGSRDLMDAAETLRGAVDVQGATPWHYFGPEGKVKNMNAVRFANEGAATPERIAELKRIANKYGFEDAVDTGDGVTITNFYEPKANYGSEGTKTPIGSEKHLAGMAEGVGGKGKVVKGKENPGTFNTKTLRAMEAEMGLKEGDLIRGRQEGSYLGYEDDWAMGEGSGAVVKRMMNRFDGLSHGTLKALDNNKYLPDIAANRRSVYSDYAEKYGGARQDVDNLLAIIAEGPGWMSRLKSAMAAGAVLPALGAFALTDMHEQTSDSNALPMLSGGGS